MRTLSQDILAVACAGNTLTGTVSSGIFSHGLGVKGCGVISSMLLADIIKYHTNSPATSGVSYCYTMLQISAWQNLPTLIIPYHPLEWQDVKKCSRTYSAYSAFTCLFLNIIYRKIEAMTWQNLGKMTRRNDVPVQTLSLLGVKAWGNSLGMKVCGTTSTALLVSMISTWLAVILHYLMQHCALSSIASSFKWHCRNPGESWKRYVQICAVCRKCMQICVEIRETNAYYF